MYVDDTDTVKRYNKLGDKVNAIVRGLQICVAVWNGITYSIMIYDDVDNVWKTEHEKIDSTWRTKLFY